MIDMRSDIAPRFGEFGERGGDIESGECRSDRRDGLRDRINLRAELGEDVLLDGERAFGCRGNPLFER